MSFRSLPLARNVDKIECFLKEVVVLAKVDVGVVDGGPGVANGVAHPATTQQSRQDFFVICEKCFFRLVFKA